MVTTFSKAATLRRLAELWSIECLHPFSQFFWKLVALGDPKEMTSDPGKNKGSKPTNQCCLWPPWLGNNMPVECEVWAVREMNVKRFQEPNVRYLRAEWQSGGPLAFVCFSHLILLRADVSWAESLISPKGCGLVCSWFLQQDGASEIQLEL